MHDLVRRLWAADASGHPLVRLLAPVSLLVQGAVSLRNGFYDTGVVAPEKLPCGVISVGNITVGGTGKTPLVIHLARSLRARGLRPAVLTRGYGGKSRVPVQVVSDGRSVLLGYEQAGDEAVLMARALPGIPVIAGADRRTTGRHAVAAFGSDPVILDDGFQHRALFRNVDIVLLAGASPFGNGRLLPAGPLREPVRGLRRAHLVILTGTDDSAAGCSPVPRHADLFSLTGCGVQEAGDMTVFRASHRPSALRRGEAGRTADPELLRGKRICAFSGIGAPERFRATLAALGADVAAFLPFPDHHRYGSADLTAIDERAGACRAEEIVTTEKDAVRLGAFPSFLEKILILEITIVVETGQRSLEDAVLERLAIPAPSGA